LKTIVLFGAGKSATVLIEYLIATAEENKWKFIVADADKDQILAKTKNSPFAEAVEVDINNDIHREQLIVRAHVVISMMPANLHFLIAKDCVENRKHLLTASYLDDNMKSLRDEISDRKLLFLCEMGLDPGIDHMSAMKLIDQIRGSGGNITSFKSHCGGVVAPESDDNPWHYKISWNPRNVVLAGKSGAVYKEDGQIVQKKYHQLFRDCEEVEVPGVGKMAFYPNRDSLSYIPVYKLGDVATFIRTTLRHPAYCKAWNTVVNAGLCDDEKIIEDTVLTIKSWAAPATAVINDEQKNMFAFLGFCSNLHLPQNAKTNADVLQNLLETKLVMRPDDKDMIVMLHEIEYEIAGKKFKTESCLLVKGENSLQTAMAKTVGLPLGISAKLLLEGTLTRRGLQIPVNKKIYLPVLAELEKMGILFKEKTTAITGS